MLAVMLTWSSPAAVKAATLEHLVMPGPLVQGHAKLEEKCENCHQPFSKTSQSRLCLGCHKKVAADIDGRTGFHGRRDGVRTSECKSCHTDHKGRDADIVGLDKETFDHRVTDFALKDAHAKVPCAGCHKPKAKYREAPSQCIGCHKADEPHKGRLGRACGDCHSQRTWREGRFDHDKTKFRLLDKHRTVACKACHPNERYKPTPTDCYACHRLNDAHAGRYGAKCERCHTAREWKQVTFDHDRDTKYPLTGKHRTVACISCHTGPLYERKLETKCDACHRLDDAHKGRNGPKCESCHTVAGWARVTFNHDKDTKFPLRGRHAKAPCAACHKGPVQKQKLKTACNACHRPDDKHKGLNGPKCERCHTAAAWKRVTFDHNRDTKYPLRDKHAKVRCEACHTAPVYEKKLETACYACHRRNDVHAGQEGTRCERCHSEKGWSTKVFFDHDLTRFPLVGLHAVTACEECHLSGTYKDTKIACAACHAKDDAHKRRLGQDCERCHNPNGWAFWRFDHDTQTKYRLDGAHKTLECRACHRDPMERDTRLPQTCFGCHRDDDPHRGRFGEVCGRCHVTESFKQVKLGR